MFFCNTKNNSKNRKMTSFKIVIAIVVVIAINNWAFMNNIFNIFNGGASNFLSFIERFVSDVLNISKEISTGCTISVGLGAIFVQLAFIVVVSFVLYLSVSVTFRKDFQEKNTNQYDGMTVVNFATSDIYLQNNKLIC